MYVHMRGLIMRQPTIWLLASLLACGGDKDEPNTPEEKIPQLPPEIELGTGETAFEPIVDGQDLYYIRGPQGGYHFITSMLVQGIDAGNADDLDDPSNPITVFRALWNGASIDLDASTYQQGIDPMPGEPGRYQMLARKLILNYFPDDPNSNIAEIDGQEIELQLEIEDSAGTILTDSRKIIAVPHPLND